MNQTFMVSYVNRMDHLIKEKLGIKGYDRYMDDFILIHPSKEYLRFCLEEIRRVCQELRVELNPKKVSIVKLSHGFTILKTKWILTDTGRVVRMPSRKAIVYQRRKMKKQKKLLDEGVITFADVRCSYASFRGSIEASKKRRKNHRRVYHNVSKKARRSLRNLDTLFNQLFVYQRGESYERY